MAAKVIPACSTVSAQYLLEGILYSLEQAGVLLRDAVALYKTGANSSAIVLAAFAREELGRSYILRDLRKQVVGGKSVTLEEVEDKCGDHVTKQEQGQHSIVQRAPVGGGLSKLIRATMEYHPQSPEYKRAAEELARVTKLQKKRTPGERHKLRMISLYVEPNEHGTGWNRPNHTSRDKAEEFLIDAVNDYLGQYERFQRGSLKDDDVELYSALQTWVDRPELPPPQHPWS